MPKYKIVRLNLEEERHLYLRAKEGDAAAKNRLAESVAGLLASMAKSLNRRFPTVEIEELISVGWKGVAAAYAYYNPEKRIRWITYAGTSARREMFRWATKVASLHVRLPTCNRDDFSVYASPLPDPHAPASTDAVHDALSRLDSLSRLVLCTAYGIEQTKLSMPALARQLGMSLKRVRKVLSSAMASLALEPALKPDGE